MSAQRFFRDSSFPIFPMAMKIFINEVDRNSDKTAN